MKFKGTNFPAHRMIKTRVPIRDQFVRRWVMNRYGDGTAVIDVTKKSFLGIIVELGAEKIAHQHVLPKSMEDESICITLLMPDSLKSSFVNPDKAFVMARAFERMYEETFKEVVTAFVRVGYSDYDAVTMFVSTYFGNGAEDDKLAEKLRKKWRDHQTYLRKKIEKKMAA